ncbi:MAG TPA: HEXXH motif-containing putative peptide modification protein [Afipia sp.]
MLDFTAGDEPQIFAWNVDGPDFRWHQYLYDACDQSFLKTYNAHFDGAHPTLSEYSAAAEAISQSLEALQEIDPDAFDEVTNYISHIILFHSPTMNAATSMTCLGIIRLSQLREGQIWSRYLENIVHETGHHHLNFLLQEDLILLNEGDASFKSPLRRESRPLSGILHALFVLGRTIRLTRKFERSRFYRRGDRIGSSYNNAKNPGSFDEKFEDCWNILTTRADFTPLGQQLVQSIRETAYE